MSQGLNNDMAVSKTRRVVKNLRWWVLVLFLLGVTVNYITRNSLGIIAPEPKATRYYHRAILVDRRRISAGLYHLPTAVRLAYRRHRAQAGLYGLRHLVGGSLYRARRSRQLAASGYFTLLYGRRGGGRHPG